MTRSEADIRQLLEGLERRGVRFKLDNGAARLVTTPLALYEEARQFLADYGDALVAVLAERSTHRRRRSA